MRIIKRHYHGQSWAEQHIDIDVNDENCIIAIDGQQLITTPKLARAIASAIQAAADAAEEITRQRRDAGQ